MELLDREAALDVLQAAFDRAGKDGGQVVVVAGEAGIGKTALLRAFVAGLPQQVRVLEGICDDLATPRPLGPFHDVGRQAGGEFGALVRDGSDRDRLQHALLDLLGRLPPPPVVVLEDLHWADEATLDLVTVLGRRISDRPMLLVLTHRHNEVGAAHPLTRVLASLPPGAVTTHHLDPLTPGSVGSLAADRDIDAERLYELTGGNPFYVTEVLAGSALTLPPSVSFAVTARVGQLPEATRRLLQMLALIPSRVDIEVAAAIDPAWEEVLAPAEAIGMVELRGALLSFRHELARQAVAQQTTSLVARGWHARILEILTGLGRDPAELVHHAERAGDDAAVVRHAPAAAEAAHAAESHREAVAHYERALAREERLEPRRAGELWLGLARACMAAERPETEALHAAGRAVEIARAVADERALAGALAAQSRITSWAGDNRRGAEQAEEAVRIIAPLGPSPEGAQALAAAAYVALAEWNTEAAVSWASQALDMADAVGDRRNAALAHIFLGLVDIGASGDATRLEAGVATALELRDRVAAIEGLMGAATAYAFRRRYDRSLAFADRGLAVAAAHEYTSWGVYLRVVRSQLLFETGRWQEADVEVAAAFAAMSATGWARAAALAIRGRLAARRGEPHARADLERAWDLVGGSGVLQLCYPVAVGLAELAWLEDDLDRPPPALLEVAALDDVGRWPAVAGEVGVWLQRAGADPGDVTRMARPHRLLLEGRYREAAAAWRELGCVYEAAEAAVLADDTASIAEGLAALDELGAEPLARLTRGRLRAMGERVPRGPRAVTRQHPAGLTARQSEVLELLATGATNAQIAQRLVLSVRTVDHHVAAILQKLGVSSRREAAHIATEAAER